MTSKKTILLVSLAIGMVVQLCGISLLAQSGDNFKARLAPVPALNPLTVPMVAGIGSATATLSGKKLTVSGTFDKLASPATVAHLSMGQVTGVRGTSIFDLTVSKTGTGTSGTISGTFDLTAEQVDALKKGRLYVQLHSEGVPNGHLMGWLLK
jgi:hypothetical protein